MYISCKQKIGPRPGGSTAQIYMLFFFFSALSDLLVSRTLLLPGSYAASGLVCWGGGRKRGCLGRKARRTFALEAVGCCGR